MYVERKDFTLICVAVDKQGNPKEWVSKHKLEGVYGLDVNGVDTFGVRSIPTTFFINSKGKIVEKKVGKLTKSQIEQALDDLKDPV